MVVNTRGTAASLTLAGAETSLTLAKVATRNGQLLEFRLPESADQRRLDAIELESLTWQDRASLRDLVEEHGTVVDTEPPAVAQREDWGAEAASAIDPPEMVVTNEYAEVRLGTVEVAGVDVCVLFSPKLHYWTYFTPREFAAVSDLPHTTYSEFLEQPYGSH